MSREKFENILNILAGGQIIYILRKTNITKRKHFSLVNFQEIPTA